MNPYAVHNVSPMRCDVDAAVFQQCEYVASEQELLHAEMWRRDISMCGCGVITVESYKELPDIATQQVKQHRVSMRTM
jgi:hypothetical protein